MSRSQWQRTPSIEDAERIIPREEVERIVGRIRSAVHHPGQATIVTVQSWWNGELSWARNRVSLAGDRRDVTISVTRWVDGIGGRATTNQVDDVSLEAVVRVAERSAQVANRREPVEMTIRPPDVPIPSPLIWSDATYKVTAEQRGRIARLLTEGAEAKELVSAGYLELRAGEVATFDTTSAHPEIIRYDTYTQAQCSMTVRHPKGVGSGWAGQSSFDWSAINGTALAEVALDKCVKSLNPVAIEPGRYTVILEPQAVADLFEGLFFYLGQRGMAENQRGPFYLGDDTALMVKRTKLGLKVVDERLTISHDPTDPLLGVLPTEGLGSVNWITNGILTSLSYPRAYSLAALHENLPELARPAYRMSGGETPIDEMIRTTKRGLLVTRFSSLTLLDETSVLATGMTRDGLWLIENGTISKAVKNMRITESPLFVLNQIEQLGIPVPVFRPEKNPYIAKVSPAIVPPIKANDFSFTATVDAV